VLETQWFLHILLSMSAKMLKNSMVSKHLQKQFCKCNGNHPVFKHFLEVCPPKCLKTQWFPYICKTLFVNVLETILFLNIFWKHVHQNV